MLLEVKIDLLFQLCIQPFTHYLKVTYSLILVVWNQPITYPLLLLYFNFACIAFDCNHLHTWLSCSVYVL